MKINIDLKKLIANGLSPNEYVYLHLLKSGSKIIEVQVDLKKIESLGFIRIIDGEVVLRPKIEKLISRKEALDTWVQDYREIFRGMREFKAIGDKATVIHKMTKFMNQYPEFSVEDIMDAANRYVNQCKVSNIPARQADHFIMKDVFIDGQTVNVSDLLSTLEETSNSVKQRSIVESTNVTKQGDWNGR